MFSYRRARLPHDSLWSLCRRMASLKAATALSGRPVSMYCVHVCRRDHLTYNIQHNVKVLIFYHHHQ